MTTNVHADPNCLVVAGHTVRMRERLPLKIGHRLPALLQACQDQDLNTQVTVLALVIESWDLPGDPTDPAAYEDLDVFTEMVPLATAVGERLLERLNRDPKAKASANGSISP